MPARSAGVRSSSGLQRRDQLLGEQRAQLGRRCGCPAPGPARAAAPRSPGSASTPTSARDQALLDLVPGVVVELVAGQQRRAGPCRTTFCDRDSRARSRTSRPAVGSGRLERPAPRHRRLRRPAAASSTGGAVGRVRRGRPLRRRRAGLGDGGGARRRRIRGTTSPTAADHQHDQQDQQRRRRTPCRNPDRRRPRHAASPGSGPTHGWRTGSRGQTGSVRSRRHRCPEVDAGDRTAAHRAGAAPGRRRPGDHLGGDRPRRRWSRVEAEGGGAGRGARPSRRTGTTTRSWWSRACVPGRRDPYEVFARRSSRSGREPDSPYPPPVIRTRPADDGDQPVRLVFGSCREATQHATARKLPPDALDAYARRLMADPASPEPRPDLLVLLGDQVYADKPSAKVKRFLQARAGAAGHRRPGRPGGRRSTSTRSSTWSRGATRRSAGCSPPCRA